MPKETERKFIMNPSWFDSTVYTHEARQSAKAIEQYYLPGAENIAYRLRIVNGSSAFLTIKGPKTNGSGSEFEYDIPVLDARQMVEEFPCLFIKKLRFRYEYNFRIYDVDAFQLDNGHVFILAELEGDADGDESIFTVPVPPWSVKEVTDDPRYSNYNLAKEGFPEDPVYVTEL